MKIREWFYKEKPEFIADINNLKGFGDLPATKENMLALAGILTRMTNYLMNSANEIGDSE